MDDPSLRKFKAELDGALDNLTVWVATLPVAGWLNLNDIWGLYHPKLFFDFYVILFNEAVCEE